MRYPQHYNGDVVAPLGDAGKQHIRMACCDCDLVHDVYLMTNEDGRVAMRIDRNNRATAQMRRHSKRQVIITDG